MTPNGFLKYILKQLVKEKGKAYVEKIVSEYDNKDSQDRYRVKKALYNMLKD